jgi:hypothetical protein
LARYRLRFLLQEFDLPPGESIIGRGPDCRITIIDPLVSRHHARVVVDGETATIEDLGSRNGLRVNGHVINGAQALSDGDRIRIGTQDLAFTQIDTGPQSSSRKATGFLCQCKKCHTPYPQEMQRCPNCGSEDKEDERAPAEELDDSGRQTWALQLLMEMLEKAILHGRSDDAERILGQAILAVEERLKIKAVLDVEHVDAVGAAAARVSCLQRTGKWAKWALELHDRTERIPSLEVMGEISKLPRAELVTLAPAVGALVRKSAQGGRFGASEHERLERLQALYDSMGGG